MVSSTNFKEHLSCSGGIFYDDLGHRISVSVFDSIWDVNITLPETIRYYSGFRSYKEAVDFMEEHVYNKSEEELEGE